MDETGSNHENVTGKDSFREDDTNEEEKEEISKPEDLEDSDSDEEKCGMKRPTLLEQLRTILDTYPDDAQIIKELIQNAEDANAKEIKLLHDKRVIEPEGVYGKYLKAPALCVYNDATFTDEDWDGIISIYNSVKKSNKLKVGRFGLGFKSVFHMTDHPVIISRDKMLIIDPLKSLKSDDEVCDNVRLKRLAKPKHRKSVEHILGIFDFNENALENAHFNGTLFWFPLRDSASHLSDNIYTEKKIDELFCTFEEEAPIVLLFLKSLLKIEVCKMIDQTPATPTDQLYTVTMSGCNGDLSNREEFRDEVLDLDGELPESSIWSTYAAKITVSTENCDTERDWVIVNYIQGTDDSTDTLINLATDPDLSYSPYVGIACPCADIADEDIGHVFCFLPLPLQKRSLTGLPVHVNGLFALEQNRRHVKWGSADHSKVQTSKDKHVQWNEHLIVDVLPKAYEHLVDYLINKCEEQQNDDRMVSSVIKSIPTPSCTNPKWGSLLKQLLHKLLIKDIFFTKNNDGQWIPQSEAVFPIFDPDICSNAMENIITRTILEAGENFVSIPPTMREILTDHSYNTESPRGITPTLLKEVLVNCDYYQSYRFEDKLRLLEFAVADGNYAGLEGLELLPLSDGAFGTFQSEFDKEDTIYLCDNGEEEIFCGLAERFVSTRGLLSEKIIKALTEIAESGEFQLLLMEHAYFPSLYQDTIEKNCNETDNKKRYIPFCNKMNMAWLEKVWLYINSHYEMNDDFEILMSLPLIADKQTTEGNVTELLPLRGFYVIGQCEGMSNLPDMLDRILPFFCIIKIRVLPDFLKILLGKVVKYPTHDGIFQLLTDVLNDSSNSESATEDLVQEFNANCLPEHKEAFLNFLSENVTDVPPDIIHLLRLLQTFQLSTNVINHGPKNTEEYTSLEEVNSVVPDFELPVPYLNHLIQPQNENIKHFAKMLGAETKEFKDIIKDVLEDIQQTNHQCTYTSEQKQTFMKYFLRNISYFDEESIQSARTVAFLPSRSSTDRFCAAELFDPRDEHLQRKIIDFQTSHTSVMIY